MNEPSRVSKPENIEGRERKPRKTGANYMHVSRSQKKKEPQI